MQVKFGSDNYPSADIPTQEKKEIRHFFTQYLGSSIVYTITKKNSTFLNSMVDI